MATAQAIDNQIQIAEMANGGNRSPLHGMGNVFLQLEDKYGVSAAVVCAISMRECQLGAASNDAIVPYNNFGGNTCGAVGVTTNNGCVNTAGRSWDKFPTPQAGLEAIFQTLNDPLYRQAGPRLEDVMNVYSPPFENNYTDLWNIFANVGKNLGTTLDANTNVYTKDTGVVSPKPGWGNTSSSSINPLDDLSNWLAQTIMKDFSRVVLFLIGMVLLFIGGRKLI